MLLTSFNYSDTILGEICLEHVTCLGKRLMQRERGTQCVRCVGTLGELEIIPHKLLIHGMHAVLNDTFGTLYRALATQVGYALFRNEDLDGVFRMVNVAGHRHDSGNLASFLDRGA